MQVQKSYVRSDTPLPIIAAFPYRILVQDEDRLDTPLYDPACQRTIYAGRNYSTCREEDSVFKLFGPTKNDTKKDD